MPGDNNHNGTQRTHSDPGHLIAWDGDSSTVPLPGQPDRPVAPGVDPQAINGFASTVSQPAEPPGVDLEGTIAAPSSLQPFPAEASEAAPEGDRAAPGHPRPAPIASSRRSMNPPALKSKRPHSAPALVRSTRPGASTSTPRGPGRPAPSL